ncbi:hypothetical protein SAMN04490185_1350 [Pseudomonas frederiksbergensis]|uniref:Uncharacterized protein n=1 Tax=Pseudomonas frederiksbergensis TaxID=104087 RepID=A0A1H4S6E7_9PSED|nr:hypothetical protein [Pseudomonas frederiksbergensis]SEC39776.1 hypothetical protein SAMN04490185_1350 [Pseudomonas frederiksbergensis]
MKWKVLDWKFALTSLIAIVSVVIPFYFWKADFTAHSLTVRLVSSSDLELPSDSKIHDLQITVNGSKIDSPHIYSLALINTGSKPILSADFETSLEVRTKNDSKLITAQITGSDPAGIPAKVSIEENRLKFLPFLSNPKDQVTVTIVSSGPLDLVAHARIAGVRDIIFEDMTQNQSRPFTASLTGVVAVTSLTFYLFFLGITDFRSVTKIGPMIKIPTTMVCVMSGVYFASKTCSELGLTGYFIAGMMFLIFALAWVFATFLTRSNRALNPPSP